ncbi:hypothetical protein N473_07085 [Pseudoalteromonas luteoviolacea CPMOR-1]|uniref:Uncharacterized protein n=1 Tax=Pseudoalteromonas luteoviolacea CPMOR-1 TaxID=1365248 RepID=A0A167H4T4_9GAMM|nr:DUF2786 domain-containing protein [Pseudoalteromonas luteoviolacea]KZN57633.1 hypothetical protein N473_07085 [Pseudoalteromonas luteoviolacea CPMOR-1]
MDKRILSKIKRCLALAKSATNEHEAAAAMRSAQALMEKHRISIHDVGFADIDEQRTVCGVNRVVRYQAMFINLIERAFGVDSFIQQTFSQSEIRFIGIAPQPELASYCWDVMWAKLKADRAKYVQQQSNRCKRSTKIARGDRFAEGWVISIYEQVSQFARTDTENQLIEAYKTRHYPDLAKRSGTNRSKKANVGNAIIDGIKAGKKHSINRPLNGDSQRKLAVR